MLEFFWDFVFIFLNIELTEGFLLFGGPIIIVYLLNMLVHIEFHLLLHFRH